jgi:hypothetical protein
MPEIHPVHTESISLAGSSYSSVRESALNTLLLPRGGLEVGGEITFLTSSLSPKEGEALVFSDIGLVTLSSRYSFGPVELAAAGTLLVKQPSYMDEWVPQAGSLTALFALGVGQAVALRFATGPLLQDKGLWEAAELALQAKRDVDQTLVFKGTLGGTFTHLNRSPSTQKTFWFSEVVVSLETVLRTPHRAFAAWAGAELRIPVAGSPDRDDPDPAGFLDPHTRLNFILASAYTLVDDWDLYARFAVIDRGDKSNPESMLPILDGGFDQQQLTIGVIHRWDLDKKKHYVAE